MATQADYVGRISANLDADLQCTQELLDLLKIEREALQVRDAEKLQLAVSAKQGCLGALERNDKERKAIQRQFRHMEWPDLIEKLDPNGSNDLQRRWDELKVILRECRDLTDVNERIVARTRLSVGKLLTLMRGQAGVASAPTYDRFGRSNPYSGGRAVTTA